MEFNNKKLDRWALMITVALLLAVPVSAAQKPAKSHAPQKQKNSANKAEKKAEKTDKTDVATTNQTKPDEANAPLTLEQLTAKFAGAAENDRFDALTRIVAQELPESAEFLRRAATDRHWLVRAKAMQLIAWLKPAARAELLPLLLAQAELKPHIQSEEWFVRGSAVLSIADILAQHQSDAVKLAQDSFELLATSRLDGEPFVRRVAIRAIAASNDSRAVEFIAPLLTDEDNRVGWEAALALSSIGDRRAVNALQAARQLTKSRAYSVALYQFGEQESLPELLAAIDEVDPTLRRPLIKILCQSNDPRTLPALQRIYQTLAGEKVSDIELKLSVIAALGRTHNPAVTAQLLTLSKDDDREIQLAALAAIGENQDSQVVTPLIESLINVPDRELGDALIATIAKFEQTETVDALFKARKNKDGQPRPAIELVLKKMGITVDSLSQTIRSGKSPTWQGPRAAARWLSNLGINASIEPLVAALSHTDEGVRTEAARALGALGDRVAIEPLMLVLDDSAPEARKAAIESLKLLGVNNETLATRLTSSEWRVRADAALLAGRMGLTDLTPLLIKTALDPEAEVKIESIVALSRLRSRPAADTLTIALDDENARVRSSAAIALGYIGNDQAALALVRALNSYDVALGALAADALIRLKTPAAAPALIATLASRNWRARAQAARVLGQMQEQSSIQSLIGLLADKAAPVRYYACQSLSQIGEPAVTGLIDCLRKDNRGASRYGAARALSVIGKPAVDGLCSLLQDTSSPVKITAATVLAEIGDIRAVDPLVLGLDDEQFIVRQNISVALGRLGRPALEPLLESLKSKKLPKRRAAAAVALKLLGDSEAVPALLEALTDKDDQVRANAADALSVLADLNVITKLEELAKSDKIDTVRAAARAAINQIQARK